MTDTSNTPPEPNMIPTSFAAARPMTVEVYSFPSCAPRNSVRVADGKPGAEGGWYAVEAERVWFDPSGGGLVHVAQAGAHWQPLTFPACDVRDADDAEADRQAARHGFGVSC